MNGRDRALTTAFRQMHMLQSYRIGRLGFFVSFQKKIVFVNTTLVCGGTLGAGEETGMALSAALGLAGAQSYMQAMRMLQPDPANSKDAFSLFILQYMPDWLSGIFMVPCFCCVIGTVQNHKKPRPAAH